MPDAVLLRDRSSMGKNLSETGPAKHRAKPRDVSRGHRRSRIKQERTFRMAPRGISRSIISFGLVSIPVELFPVISSKSVHFNLLHSKDDSKIREKIYCIAEDKIVDRKELVHGFPISKGEYVSFTNEELKRIEADASRDIGILEFVPIEKVDPIYFAGSYFLGSRNGSAKAYNLLTAALTRTRRAALAKFVLRNKEHLVLIRPYGNVLLLHTMHYADEIRSAADIGNGSKGPVANAELKLAERLIDDLSKDEFKPEQFKDSYREKILEMAKQKAAGHEIRVGQPERRAKVVDLMSALKESLKTGPKPRPVTADQHAHGLRKSSNRAANRRTSTARGGSGRHKARS
jgi:DNA end-binding protein Ku